MVKYVLILSIFCSPLVAETYIGTWQTTNRPLDGTLKCVLKEVKKDTWKGTFSGEWKGDLFSYNVD